MKNNYEGFFIWKNVVVVEKKSKGIHKSKCALNSNKKGFNNY